MRRFSCAIKEIKNQILKEDLANYDAIDIQYVKNPATSIPENESPNDIAKRFEKISISPRLVNHEHVPPEIIQFSRKCLAFFVKYKDWLDSSNPIAQIVNHGIRVLYQKTFIPR